MVHHFKPLWNGLDTYMMSILFSFRVRLIDDQDRIEQIYNKELDRGMILYVHENTIQYLHR